MPYLKLTFTLLLTFLLLISNSNASSVKLLQANLYSWYTMDTRKNPIPIIRMTSYINANNFDFITTQENDYLLSDAIYKLNPKYKLAGERKDASIFYDTSRWAMMNDSYTVIPMTSDGGGARIAAFAKFKNVKTGEQIAIGGTHLCIAWGGHADCVGGQVTAHNNDARKLGEQAEKYTKNNIPVVIAGDFNNLQDNLNQAQIIEATMVNYGLAAVKSGGTFIGPTFGNAVIDFVYSNKTTITNAVLYTQAQGNPSDHAAIEVTFELRK